MPRRNSFKSDPVMVLNTRIKVPLSLAVAHLVPSRFKATQLNLPEWAAMILTLTLISLFDPGAVVVDGHWYPRESRSTICK